MRLNMLKVYKVVYMWVYIFYYKDTKGTKHTFLIDKEHYSQQKAILQSISHIYRPL